MNEKNIAKLIEILENNEHENNGLAQEIMGKRNYVRGFEQAQKVTSIEEFESWYQFAVVNEYTGSCNTKKQALKGAEAAAKMGLTVLTGDIDKIKDITDEYEPKSKKYIEDGIRKCIEDGKELDYKIKGI